MTFKEEKKELLKKVGKIMHNNISEHLSEKNIKQLFFMEKFGQKCKKLTEQEYIDNLKEYVNDYEHLEKLLDGQDHAKDN